MSIQSRDTTSVLYPELLCKIFIHAVQNDDERLGWNGKCNPATLGAVCNRWRAIALSTPAIWASISISYTNTVWEDKNMEEKLRLRISRSGHHPLELRIYIDSVASRQSLERISQLLKPHLSRVRCLWNFSSPKRIIETHTAWPCLTSLGVYDHFTPLEALIIFQNANRLTYVELFLTSTMADYRQQSVLCPHLRTLFLHHIGSSQGLINNLILPSLEEFTWKEESPFWTWSAFHAMVKRSACYIKELDVSYWGDRDTESLVDALRECPRLERLSLSASAATTLASHPSILVPLSFWNTSDQDIMPRLRRLELTTCGEYQHNTDNLSSLALMVSSRWDKKEEWTSETRHHLEYVFLLFEHPLPTSNPDPFALIWRARLEGLDVTVSSEL